ncbi:restriction endonuclease subunit S [Lactococcus lactis]|uniref:Type I R/M system specificity subunit n=1 Tax=Lactococcus lactis subsp. lactis A12 TaxID=1137134 RepID=S6EWF6_LACLL|nr:restriction endonuclease subunit S [Lactococcus lactis]CDG03693.1 Type I R/M system specificity subunit [Lactococcus lactis subsp. lactis A12]SBW29655.1 Type I R/M system specificity subunit [Lactococcus lactis subsp. lactis]
MSENKKIIPKRRFKEFQNADAWEQRELGDLAEIVRGASPRPIQNPKWFDRNSEIGWLRISDVTEQNGRIHFLEQRISEAGQGKTRVLHSSHLLLSIAATVGKPVVNYVPTGVHDGFLIFLNPKFDLEFMFQWLEMFRPQWQKYGQPGSQVNLNSDLVKNQKIFIPSLGEQKEISSFFTNLDQTIAFQQRKLEKMKSMKSAYLSEMFPAEGERKPKRRFPGFTDDWEQRELSKIATMNARIGWQNLRTSEFLDEGNYMLITGTDFEDGKINYSTCHFVEKERYEQDKNIQIKNGSILITKDGTLGKVAYVEGLSTPATLNAGVFNVKIKNPLDADEKYLFQYLKAPFLMDYVNKRATGGTIKHLNQNILVDFPVLMPKKDEQAKIGDFFHDLDQTIAFQQQKLEKLQNIKKAYLNEMFI